MFCWWTPRLARAPQACSWTPAWSECFCIDEMIILLPPARPVSGKFQDVPWEHDPQPRVICQGTINVWPSTTSTFSNRKRHQQICHICRRNVGKQPSKRPAIFMTGQKGPIHHSSHLSIHPNLIFIGLFFSDQDTNGHFVGVIMGKVG